MATDGGAAKVLGVPSVRAFNLVFIGGATVNVGCPRWMTMAMILCFQRVWVFTLAVLDGAAAIAGSSQRPGYLKHETVVGFRIISG